MDFETVRLERTGAVARLVLSRPEKLNAINALMHDELQAACAELRRDGEIRVVILTGAGRAFSAGADVRGPIQPAAANPLQHRHDLATGSRTVRAIGDLDQITIAMVNGLAIGGGVVLAMSCDLCVAAESAWFRIPELELGIPLTWGALPRLVRAAGPARTIELVGTGRRFSSHDALAWGLVSQVADDDALAETVDALASAFVAMPAIPLLYTKLAVRALGRVAELGEVSFADPDLRIVPRLYGGPDDTPAAAR